MQKKRLNRYVIFKKFTQVGMQEKKTTIMNSLGYENRFRYSSPSSK